MAAITKPTYQICQNCMACVGEECSMYTLYQNTLGKFSKRQPNRQEVKVGKLSPVTQIKDTFKSIPLFTDTMPETQLVSRGTALAPIVRDPNYDEEAHARMRAINNSKKELIERRYKVDLKNAVEWDGFLTLEAKSTLNHGECPDCGGPIVTVPLNSVTKQPAQKIFICEDEDCRLLLKVVL